MRYWRGETGEQREAKLAPKRQENERLDMGEWRSLVVDSWRAKRAKNARASM
jgi:hypothetical protein